MEELVDAGLVMRIGVCNLTTSSLRGRSLLRPHQARGAPDRALIPTSPQNAMVRYCQEEDIAITAFSPFGGRFLSPARYGRGK